MTGIEERIAEVLGAHEYWQLPRRDWECACGKRFGLKLNLAAHVAAVVAQALQPSAAEQKLAAIREARDEYEAALDRREHGGVALDHFKWAVYAVLDSDDTPREKP